MKKYIVCILLLCPSFFLYAQSGSASVFVLPVTGTGGKPDDNTFFYKQLAFEVTYQRFILANTQKDSDFYFNGTLSSHPDNADGVKQYVFHLALLETKTNEIWADGELVYEAPEDVNNLFPVLVNTLLYTIPEGIGKNSWRNKRLYAGASAFWTPRIYTAESASTYIPNFGGGIHAEYHFLDFLSVEAGIEIASDLVKVSANAGTNYRNVLMEIPVLVKYVIKPGDYFILEPYAGGHLNIPFNKTTSPPLFSWLAGFQYGVKLGPGVIFIDPRFSMDIGKSGMGAAAGIKNLSFQRYIIHLGIGYKLGFFTRR